MRQFVYLFVVFIGLLPSSINGQHSVARQWNEALLDAIRVDFARPTVHARNLFHTSMVMYDAWAAYDDTADTYFLGKTLRNYTCPFEKPETPADVQAAREEAISYAMYRLLSYRFANSPGAAQSLGSFDDLMLSLGYDTSFVSTDYLNEAPGALGNYLADQMISFGLQDGSNEQNVYMNQYYMPSNPNLIPILPGNPDLEDPNRWQPLTLDVFIDQSGNVIPLKTPSFLSPEWGIVVPFALSDDDLTIYDGGTTDYWVYHDPGAPPHIDTLNWGGLTDEYRWTFSLVAIWSSHLDPSDGVMIDISPASFGNLPVEDLPTTFEDMPDFYRTIVGGDVSPGHDINPHTGLPYEPQIVPRGDYTRVLAEFWADGPDSETPPGHWFTILNYVNDHPLFEKRFMGQDPVLPELEWDVKAYFILGGAVHDAAVTAWGIKGWYDYIRPISAIRWMADNGQSSSDTLPHYHPGGFPLVPGYIELVQEGDPLVGAENEHLHKIKIRAWKGPDYINDPDTSTAGVDWILAENWWPYQRPTFITPPFAGYISGHSTFSRAAAEVMTVLTGDPFFPGGMGEFHCARNEFLVFEDGPSVDLTLQWATYRDASDQTSLSRIWGGIHPPADDIPGRIIGVDIAADAFERALCYFSGGESPVADFTVDVQDSAIVLSNLTANATSYTWDFGDGTKDSTAQPMHVYTSSGEYDVILIASNACGADTLIVPVQITLSPVEDILARYHFAVTPNPNYGTFVVHTENLEPMSRLRVISAVGQVVLDDVLSGTDRETVDLSGVRPGVYFAVLESDHWREVVKVVVE